MSGGWQDEDVDGWKDGERTHWPGVNLTKFMLIFEGLRIVFWGTFVDRVGAPERAQINIHDHRLRMLIFEGLPANGGVFLWTG